ncbi:MAG: hypothetical protein CL920_11045 [Deltaproteobacteria bacterium]|nr:hypothetical protein [Deltaproteobacteria bacterium]
MTTNSNHSCQKAKKRPSRSKRLESSDKLNRFHTRSKCPDCMWLSKKMQLHDGHKTKTLSRFTYIQYT